MPLRGRARKHEVHGPAAHPAQDQTARIRRVVGILLDWGCGLDGALNLADANAGSKILLRAWRVKMSSTERILLCWRVEGRARFPAPAGASAPIQSIPPRDATWPSP